MKDKKYTRNSEVETFLYFLKSNYSILLAIFITLIFIVFKNVIDVSFDSLWYAAYVKAFPQNLGAWDGGTMNHFLHPRHIIFHPIAYFWWKLLSIFIYITSYEAMQSLSAVFLGLAIVFVIKLVDQLTNNNFIAVFCAISYSFNYVLSWHATIPEVYTLSSFMYLLLFYYIYKNTEKKFNLKSILVLTLFSIVSLLVHIQFIPIILIIFIYLLFIVRPWKYKLLYSTIYLSLTFLTVSILYLYLANAQWDIHTSNQFAEILFGEKTEGVNLLNVFSPKGLLGSFSNNSAAVFGEGRNSVFIGITLFLINIYVGIIGYKRKKPFFILCSLIYLFLFVLLRVYEIKYTSGTWLKLWLLLLTQQAISMGIFLKYLLDRLKNESIDYFYLITTLLMIFLIIFNLVAITIPKANKYDRNRTWAIVKDFDSKITETKDLYINLPNKVFRLYFFVFSKVSRVYNYTDPNEIPKQDVYVLMNRLPME